MLSTRNGRNIIQAIPHDRILTETDGPFIKIAGREIKPADVKLTEEVLSEFLGINGGDVSLRIRENLKNLLQHEAATKPVQNSLAV